MVDLYYEILRLDKKGCKFKFTLVKSKDVNVYGVAEVEFMKSHNSVRFDSKSDARLKKEEKEYIVSYVLKYTEVNRK